MHEVVVEHDVGRREALQAAHGDEARIAGAGADQIDDASHRGRQYRCTRRVSSIVDIITHGDRHGRCCDCRLSTAGCALRRGSRRRRRRAAARRPARRAPPRRAAGRAPARGRRGCRRATTTAATSSSSSPSTARPARRSASGSRRRAPRPARARRRAPPRPPRSLIARHDAPRRASSPARISIATMPCPGAGTHAVGRQRQRDARREAEPPQSGRRQHERIVLALVELAQPRVEVAANRREARAGKQPRQLRDAPDAAGADRRRLARASATRSSIVELRRRALIAEP